MTQRKFNALTRRSFLSKAAAMGATASAFTLIKPELVRGAGKERLKAGLVGCGGRGTEAAVNLLLADPHVELIAMGDIFEDKLKSSLSDMRDPKYLMDESPKRVADFTGKPLAELIQSVQQRVKVDPEHCFVGFDAFKKVLASDIDVILLCTPPGYRPEHFEAAIDARKHVFTEKPIATDPVGTRRFISSVKKAEQLKLTVVAGTQMRSEKQIIETVQKIRSGAIGEVVGLGAYYLSGPVMHADHRDPNWGDMEWQNRNWYSFLWICGDQLVEQHIHMIDFCNWVMGAHPVKVAASGGAAWRPREELYGNIYDHLSAEFVYPNGVSLNSTCRQYPEGSYRRVWNTVVGAKGRSDGRDMGSKGMDPYVQEHIRLVNSIRGDSPYTNDGMAVAESTMTCIMGRESAYSGLEITWDMIMASKQDLLPRDFDYKLWMDVPPVPVPGKYKFI
jgi:myo-inositol 2-dehydrogenase / D-chiro-inositol 1-dehydrogenase